MAGVSFAYRWVTAAEGMCTPSRIPDRGCTTAYPHGEGIAMEIPRSQARLEDDPRTISRPVITQPLYGCAKAVNVTGYIPGATIDVEVDGAVVVTGFPGGSPTPWGALIGLPAPLDAHRVPPQRVRARQHFDGATSDWTDPVEVRDHAVDYPAGLPRPDLFALPLNACGVRTGVGNLLVGCDVEILVNGAGDGAAQGANNPQGINLVNPYADTQHVRARATLCGDPSPLAAEQVVQVAPLPLAAPTFAPFAEGGTDLVIQGVVSGARVELKRNGVPLGAVGCWGGSLTWSGINPPIKDPSVDRYEATQQLCPGDPPSPPGTGYPTPCSGLRAPTLWPVQAGAIAVAFTDFVPGSRIKVFVNGKKEGDGSGPLVWLNHPVPHGAIVDAWQSVGECAGSTVDRVPVACVAPPVFGDPSALDLFPVGTREYQGAGTVSFDGFTYHVHGSIFYPAEDDGPGQPFHQRLAALGRVPLVVLVHGRHGSADSYQGYEYFQAQLARMGFVVVSVDESETDPKADADDGPGNIVRRAELAIESIKFLKALDGGDPVLAGRMDFTRIGLMGHSRGGDCVLAVAERLAVPGATVRAVLSLAPVDSGVHSGRPKGFAFMTILPAADGDVIENPGARFYDGADPAPFKAQLYVDRANHNYFNRKWQNDDSLGTVPIMSRYDHERILSAYGCAFFRHALRGDPTFGYLDRTLLPAGVLTGDVHISCAVAGARTVDDYEAHPITQDNEGQPTTEAGLAAGRFPFMQAAGAFNASFFGATNGNVLRPRANTGSFREPLREPADLTKAEVRVRAAEVYQAPAIAPAPTGFRVGLEDDHGTIAWLDVDDVGGLARPFDRHALDTAKQAADLVKTMLSTYRFAGHCFAASDGTLRLDRIQAIHLGLNRSDQRPIAFDDLAIVAL
jgi:dienelactone hydrolase